MAKINIYLHFESKTEEAFNFYKSVFGGQFSTFLRYSNVPDKSGFGEIPDTEKNKIMHVELPIGNTHTLMGADTLESMRQKITFGNNFAIFIRTSSRGETEKIFNGLSTDGKITMPLTKTFWSEYFGTCNDKFGIPWKVSYEIK